MSQMIVVEEKHGTHYLDASTDEAWAHNSWKLLKQRHATGYTYYDPGDAPEWNGLSLEEIKGLKAVDEDAYQAVVKKWNRYVAHKRAWKIEREWYDRMLAEVNSPEPTWVTYRSGRRAPTAWAILDDRSDHEYEHVELETLRNL